MEKYLVFIPWLVIGFVPVILLLAGKAAARVYGHVQRMAARRDLYRNMKRYYRIWY